MLIVKYQVRYYCWLIYSDVKQDIIPSLCCSLKDV